MTRTPPRADLSPPGPAQGHTLPATRLVRCEHADRCAGCPLIDRTYEEQLAFKQARVAEALARYERVLTAEVAPIAGATPVIEYRTRAKWIAGGSSASAGGTPRGDAGALGLYAKGGGHEVVDIPGCRVVTPAIRAAADAIRSAMRARATRWLPQSLLAVDLREVVEPAGVLVTLVVDRTATPSKADARTLGEELMASEPCIVGVALNPRDRASPQVLGPDTLPVAGAREAWDVIGDARTRTTFGSFTQAHHGQATRIHAAIAARLAQLGGAPRREERGAAGRGSGGHGGTGTGTAPTVNVLDVYGGSGAIALALAARPSVSVDVVESYAPAARAVEAAAKAARRPVRGLAGDASEVLPALVAKGATYDVVVVNPPRRGVPADVREAIGSLAPRAIAYVSCEPRTLARDLAHLALLGYAADVVQPYDMIPLTEEVETLALLAPAPPPALRVLLDAGDAVFVEKAPHEPTTPQGEYRHSLLARARLLPGMADCVPVHRLDVGTSGVCLLAKRASAAHRWAEALTAGQKTYLAMAKGVTSTKGAIRRPLRDGPREVDARTRYRRVAIVGGPSLVEVRPEQGRTHQIRRHLAGIGHPILGDARYGHAPSNTHAAAAHHLDRTFLHCARIELVHPATQEKLVVTAELPGDLAAVRASMDAIGKQRSAGGWPSGR